MGGDLTYEVEKTGRKQSLFHVIVQNMHQFQDKQLFAKLLKSLLKMGDLNVPVVNFGAEGEDVSFVVFDILKASLDEVFAIVLLQCVANPDTAQYSYDRENKQFESLLHRAINLNYANMIKLLIDKGANVNAPYIYMKDEKQEIEQEI